MLGPGKGDYDQFITLSLLLFPPHLLPLLQCRGHPQEIVLHKLFQCGSFPWAVVLQELLQFGPFPQSAVLQEHNSCAGPHVLPENLLHQYGLRYGIVGPFKSLLHMLSMGSPSPAQPPASAWSHPLAAERISVSLWTFLGCRGTTCTSKLHSVEQYILRELTDAWLWWWNKMPV